MTKRMIVCRPAGPRARSGAAATDSALPNFELAVLRDKRWPGPRVRLTTGFMDTRSPTLRKMILSHLNAWSKSCDVRFIESDDEPQVRIARLDSPPDFAGYWSYEGTDILTIPQDEPTMNLEGFTARTPLREFRRVVRHEAGHTLGFPHEHMRNEFVQRIDPRKAVRFFRAAEGWTAAQVRAQVLTPLEQRSVFGSRPNPNSIMCYQIPGDITRDGTPILGGADIDPDDFAFAARVYPRR